MSRILMLPRSPVLGLALPAMLFCTTALADLTPAQVWGDWQNYLGGMGYQVTGTEAENGGNLTVSDIAMRFDIPEDGGSMALDFGTIAFNQNSDGSVSIVIPDTLPMIVDAKPSGSDPAMNMQMTLQQSDHALTASGSPSEITYDYQAGRLLLGITEMTADGETIGADAMKFDVTANNLTSSTTMTLGALRSYVQNGQIADLAYDIFFKVPDEPGQFSLNGSISDVALNGGGMIPLSITNTTDMAAMVKAGFDVNAAFTYGAGNTVINIQDPSSGNQSITTSSSGGELKFAMGQSGLAYSGAQNNLQMNVTAAELPFPVELSMAEGGFNFAMPVTKSEDPQDFALGIKLGDFVLSDLIWSVFDPTGQLPRDPATIDIDLTGQAKLLIDYLDPNAAAQLVGPPLEANALSINKLLLDAAGAKLEGNGQVSFDNNDTTILPGMPKPVGEVNMALAGGNALLDKLVAMGLLPEDQAMGARMMLGVFTRAGAEPDTLTSKIEFTNDGQILANGQRIR